MIPQKIGHYTIQSELGHTDLASTYLAWDEKMQTQVVVKSLLPVTLTDPSVRGRYQLEMQIVASLTHPTIVPVLAFGEENERLFIVMPYVSGGSLSERLAQGKLEFVEAVRITQRIASALDAAHALGITHGNIKPSNILFDADGNPLLTDFGMIMFAESAAGQKTDVLIGPPGYISPEVALCRASDEKLTVQDVYMLGILFYQMVMGHLPYLSETVVGYAVSQVVAPIPEISDLDGKTQKGVNAVLQRSLAKSSAERFVSAGEFVEALLHLDKTSPPKKTTHAWLLPTQIRTKPLVPHWVQETEADIGEMQTIQLQRGGRSWRVSRLLSCVGVAVFFIVFVATGLFWGLAFLRQGLVSVSDLNRFLPPQAVAFAGTFVPSATPLPVEKANTPTLPTVTPTVATRVTDVVFTPTVELPASPSEIVADISPTPEQINGSGEPTPLVPPTDHTIESDDTIFSIAAQFNVNMSELIALNGWNCGSRPAVGVQIQIPASFTYGPLALPDALLVENATQFALHHTFECMSGIRDVAISADGRLLAVAVENLVYLWQVGDWKPYVTLKGHIGPVNRVRFAPDSTVVATASDDTSVRLWQVSDGIQLKALYQHKKPVTDIAYAPDGSQILSVSQEKAQFWSNDGAVLKNITGSANWLSAAYDREGTTVAVGGMDSVGVYTSDTQQQLVSFFSADPVARLAFSPDSTLLASSSDVWHVPEKRAIYHLQSSRDSVAFALDGQVLLTGRRLWQVSNGLLLGDLSNDVLSSRSQRDAESVAISPDGDFLLLGTKSNLTLWALPSSYQKSTAHVPPVYIVQPGDTLYSIASSHGVKLPAFRQQNGFECDSPIFPNQWVQIPDAPDAQLTLTAANLSVISAQNVAQIVPQRALEMDCNITASDLIFSSDNQKLIGGSALWDIPSGAMLVQATIVPLDLAGKPEVDLRAPILELSPDNRLIAMRLENQISLWDVDTGHPVRAWAGHEGPITSLAFSPDGSLLASGSAVGEPAIRLWQVENAKLEWLISNYSIFRMMFSLDGQSLIAMGEDTIRIWSVLENAQRWALRGLDQRLTISPDKTLMAFVTCLQKTGSSCTNEGISIYALDRGVTLPGVLTSSLAKLVQAIQFSPDGTQIAAATEYGITVWNMADNTVVHWLAIPDRKDFMERVWYSPDGSIIVAYDERQNLYFWRASDGELLYSISSQPVDRLSFSPDGKLMAILAQGVITLWGIQP